MKGLIIGLLGAVLFLGGRRGTQSNELQHRFFREYDVS